MLFIGFLLSHSAILPRYKPIFLTHKTEKIFILSLILISMEFVHNRGVPLLMILDGLEYNYVNFGIKTIHVFILTFVSFYTTYLFHLFISTKDKKILIETLLLLSYPLLIMNRGAWLITTTSLILIFIMSFRSIKLKSIFNLIILLLIILFIFGSIGDTRMKSKDTFVSISKPNEDFNESNIPKSYLWAYIYITSPLGNLQATIDQKLYESLRGFIFGCMMPDFISKRLDVSVNPSARISPVLNVGGIYALAYANMGWIGMVAIFMYFIMFIFIYLIFLPRNTPYTVTGMALISTLVIFNIFSNMMIFSGLIIQLAYPILFGVFSRRGCKDEKN